MSPSWASWVQVDGSLPLGTHAGPPEALAGSTGSSLDDFARNIMSGGPPKDGIPPIDRPKYVSASEADTFLQVNDVIFGLDHKGEAKAYPQMILVWHEIVNETLDGEKASITYCPLTGSAIGYKGRLKDGKATTFGTSGKLVNSNLLMYDRATDSQWPQILGMAITGPHKTEALDELPVVWTTWERWKRAYPKTLVLSRDTGHVRAYGQDPYGSYRSAGNTYYSSGGPFFPVMARAGRLPDKRVVMGARRQGTSLAIDKETVRRRRVVNAEVGGQAIVALYDDVLDTVRAFGRKVDGQELGFALQDENVVDRQTQSRWSPLGKAVAGKLAGAQLPWLNAFDVMWFAWYAFFPQTQVVA